MIEEKTYEEFTEKLCKSPDGPCPLSVQIELTHRCNFDCIYCYCKGAKDGAELTAGEWKSILDQMHSAGCIWLAMTGGEPLLHEDFWDIYTYARNKGFLVTIFTNGSLLAEEAIERLAAATPFSIEITLNGVSQETFESISQVPGSLPEVMRAIEGVVAAKLPLVLKAVGLKENKAEIGAIKAFSESLLGKEKFKFDSFITPALDGDKTPCRHRLSVGEIVDLEESDPDMRAQREKEFEKHKPVSREPGYKYRCNSWFHQSYIDPYGRLKFCYLTDSYSTDLRKRSFLEGFYERVPAILEERCTSDSACIQCDLREFCHHCPARAFLETGDEEAPVPYFCELARVKKDRVEQAREEPGPSRG